MLRFLGDASKPSELSTAIAPATSAPPPEVAPSTPVPAPPRRRSAASQPVRGEALVAAVVGVVADRTGYPADMLDLDLDLEADLSIDSIKRVEIVGELAERIGLDARTHDGVDDAALEALRPAAHPPQDRRLDRRARVRPAIHRGGRGDRGAGARRRGVARAADDGRAAHGEQCRASPSPRDVRAGSRARRSSSPTTVAASAPRWRHGSSSGVPPSRSWPPTALPALPTSELLAGADALIRLRALHPAGGEDPLRSTRSPRSPGGSLRCSAERPPWSSRRRAAALGAPTPQASASPAWRRR